MYAYPQKSQPSGNLTPNTGSRGQVFDMKTIYSINFLCPFFLIFVVIIII
ncbi:Uncharacterised protein [Staphylococcus intermedius NCTC 11048]|uniref:Uncharacterized protein n=1 Tax=Staphylococcus intermedius NCTC 11048 TaxID=1141106 RepID=A0A380G5R3_STAIN|nr:Uncharacterised protein [Staphylococcus intermedius NCTC 11048]